MALPPEPSIDGLPMMEIFGAALEEANGEYSPTKYADLHDSYVSMYFAPRSGKPIWQRRSKEKAYILIFVNAETTHASSSYWILYACCDGHDQGLYHHGSPPDGILPPESGWQYISKGSDTKYEPALLFSVREPRPPLLVNIGYASGAFGAGIECKSCVSGELIAVLPANLQTVKHVKTELMSLFHQYVVVMMPSGGALSEDQEKFGSLSDILSGKVPEESSVQARRALLEGVRRGDKMMQDFSKDELADRELVLAALEFDGLSLEHAPEELRRDWFVVWTAMQQRSYAYMFAMGEALDDRSLALRAVSESGDLLGNVGCKLMGDKELVYAACKQNPDGAFPFVPQNFRFDRDLLLLVLRQPPLKTLADGNTIPSVEDFHSLCVDSELQMTALRRKPSLFQHALQDVRADREFVLELLKLGKVEQVWPYVSEQLREDPQVALQAIKKSGSPNAFSFAAEKLQSSRSFILKVLDETRLGPGCFFKVLPQPFAGDRQVALAALRRINCESSDVLAMVSEDLRQDPEFVSELVKKDKSGLVFRDLPDSLRSDAALALAAVRSNLKSLQFTSGNLCADPEFVMSVMAAAVKMDYSTSDVLQYIAEDLKCSEEFCQRVKDAYPEGEEADVEFDMFG